MFEALSRLLHRTDLTKKIAKIDTYSKLQKKVLINGKPEVFIIEPLMTGINGKESIKYIKNNYPGTPIIIFSSIPRDEAEVKYLNAGVDLYIDKITSPQQVMELIRDQLGWANNSQFGDEKLLAPDGSLDLSKRQNQIAMLIDSGFSNANIAKKLEITPHTVKVHLWRLYKKLGIHSRTQLIKFCRDKGCF